MDENKRTELNNALDDFIKIFGELTVEESMDFIHLNPFLDAIYSKGWD